MSKGRILLIYPRMGPSGSLVQHMPLGILYTAIDSIKAGFAVDILDVRLYQQSWREELQKKISSETILVGLSVWTGYPILNALEISRWVKQHHPSIPIVWGGPHATFNSLEILAEPTVEYVVKGYGSKPLGQLASHIIGDTGALPLSEISGVAYRDNGSLIQVPSENKFEFIDYRDIPYDLVESDLPKYGQLDSQERIFSMYSALGCPYKCSFCSSPAQYRPIKKKYETLDAKDVADHVEYVHRRYGASYVYFIDDDSFPNLRHVDDVISEIKSRNIKVKLGFRGARINEIKRMDDAYLTRLAEAGTDIMHVGAESGSQRILDLIRKDCSVQDIIDVNRKMARHPEIKTAYNWIVGLPGETSDDLRKSQNLMMQIVKDNPSAILFAPNKFRPLPGTELYDIAVQYGYKPPTRLEEWAEIEAESDYQAPWYTREQGNLIRMMQVTSYFVDDKVFKVTTGRTMFYKLIRFLSRLYSPIARLRLKHHYSGFLIEHKIFNWAMAAARL